MHGALNTAKVNSMTDPLDNPVWQALVGPHARIAIGRGQARHYPRDMAPFSAIANDTTEAYADLASDLPPGIEARLFRPCDEPLRSGWLKVDAFPMLQMVMAKLPAEAPVGASPIDLTHDDLASMMELAEIAKPGPFGPRTTELGSFVGVRSGARLVAMAGERMRLPGYVELSAIAVHPDARGRGLAACLTCALAKRALSRGEKPFLHVRPENTAAVSLYRRPGFEVRRELWVLWRKLMTAAGQPTE
jgi:ribosomal protein S18 acetylase RimI-like enzyme